MKPAGIIIKLALALALCCRLQAQHLLVYNDHIGFNLGLNLAFGTHFQRAGINVDFFYTHRSFQANSQLRAYFNFKNLGPQVKYPELVLSQGLLYAYGSDAGFYNPFFSAVSNQTYYSNSIAYAYNAYFNKKKTTQQTGTLAFQFGHVTVIAENDILGHTFYDRFRTGAFLLQYQYQDRFQAGLNCTLWTGQMGRSVRDNKNYPAICYMDTTGGTYTNYSHGLLSAQFKYNVGYSQNVQASVGVDAEQVRNAVQNKFIHDMVFIPRKWIRPKNCHIPMVDDKGRQYLYDQDQRIRSPKLYMNLFSNAGLFY